MEEVDALVEAMSRHGSPFLSARRPGLSPADLRAAARRHLPWWADHIDGEVCAWYGWHNGADRDALAHQGVAAQGCFVITPDDLALHGIHELLLDGWKIVGPDYAERLGIVFPLGRLDSTAGEVMLHKRSPDDEWTVCRHYLESGLEPLVPAGDRATPPTFRDWLTALTNALDAGRLVIGRYGNITVPGGGAKRTAGHFYPWVDGDPSAGPTP